MKESHAHKIGLRILHSAERRHISTSAAVPRSKFLVQSAVWSSVIAVLTLSGFPFPPPLSTINLAPIAIFVAGIYLGPRIGLVAATIGSTVGFLLGVNLGTITPGPTFFTVFLFGIIVARGPEGLIVGLLREQDESIAMMTGTVYETLTFFLIDYFYTYPVIAGVTGSAALAAAAADFLTLLDLIYIGPAIVVLRALRAGYGRKYYDKVAE